MAVDKYGKSITDIDTSSRRPVIHLNDYDSATLYPIDSPDGERLKGLYEQVVRGKVSVEDWLKAIDACM